MQAEQRSLTLGIFVLEHIQETQKEKESVSILNYLKTKLEKVGQLDMVWKNPLSQTLHSLNLDLEELMLTGKMTSHQILRKNLQCHLLIVRQSVKHSIFVIIIIKQ